jgi:hypothetical protein
VDEIMNMGRGKKGVFYTLSVIIVILILLVIFSNRLQVFNNDEDFKLGRAKILVMDRFVTDFDNYYAKNILETATKPALIQLTADVPHPFTNSELIDLMYDGDTGVITMDEIYATQNNFDQALGTLTFELENAQFIYVIDDIRQINYTTIMISFRAEYHFTSFGTTWEKTGKIINITVSVYDLFHPDKHLYIDTDWVIDPVPSDCFIDQVFSDSPGCTVDLNIMPPPP